MRKTRKNRSEMFFPPSDAMGMQWKPWRGSSCCLLCRQCWLRFHEQSKVTATHFVASVPTPVIITSLCLPCVHSTSNQSSRKYMSRYNKKQNAQGEAKTSITVGGETRYKIFGYHDTIRWVDRAQNKIIQVTV